MKSLQKKKDCQKESCEVLLLLCLEDILKNFKRSLFCFIAFTTSKKNVMTAVTYQCLALHNDTATVCVIYIYKGEVLMSRCGLIHDDKLFWREVVEEWFILLLMFRTPNFLVVLCSAVSNWFIHTSSECAAITQHMWPHKVWDLSIANHKSMTGNFTFTLQSNSYCTDTCFCAKMALKRHREYGDMA